MKKLELLKRIEATKVRSWWDEGVKLYASDLLEDLDQEDLDQSNLLKTLLNGAENWKEYSWGGCSLIYDEDIAWRLCTPSELKKTKEGQKRPNAREEWLDVQARALYQAYYLIKSLF